MTSDPWDEIRPDRKGFTWLASDSGLRRRCLFGKSHEGTLAFLFENGANNADVFSTRPSLSGLQLDYQSFPASSGFGLILILQNTSDRDIFLLLCRDLEKTASGAENERQACKSVLKRLERWQKLLSRKASGLLSIEQIRGLVAELVVMKWLSDEAVIAHRRLLGYWEGPCHAAKDFRLSHADIEVKAASGTGSRTIRIASAEQLQRDGNPLFLSVVPLIENDEAQESISLNELVQVLSGRFENTALDLFEEKLAEVGYLSLPAYDGPRFLVQEIQWLSVSPGFPALTSENVPEAISRVRYEIDTAQLSDFEIEFTTDMIR